MKLSAVTLKRPIAASVIAIAVFVIGLFSLSTLEIDYLPDITYPMVKVNIWWRGATPDDIDKNIADPIERVMSTIDDLDYLESSTIEGMYVLLVNFRYGTDIDAAYQDVIAAMGRVSRNLPTDIDPPVILKADPSQLPVMEVTVFSDQRDLVWLRDWCDNWLQDRITTVPGTAGVEIVGGLKREIRIHLDPSRLNAYNITPAYIAQVLFEENREIFAGRVTVESREIIARTMGEFESLDEIRDVVVARNGNRFVYLKDVATVEDSHENTRVITRFNGRNCVKLSVLKQAEANTVITSNLVRDRLDELKSQIPADIEFGVVENQGDYVLAAINSVTSSIIIAAILVILVILIFLGEWRPIIVMLIALPLTVVANFIFMRSAGYSLNVFSLGGLVVAMGVVIDNSIVAVENMTRLKKLGERNFAQRGIEQVGTPILASTLSFLALVLPFLFVPGLITLLFKELILSIAGIVVISLVVAWTITTLVTDRILRWKEDQKTQAASNNAGRLILITYTYTWLLKKFLWARWIVISLGIIILVAGIWLVGRTGSEFLPEIDDGRIMIKLRMPAGTSVETTNGILADLEKRISGDPAIESMFTMAGGRVWGLITYEISHEGEVDIQLVPKSKRKITTDDFIKKIQPIVKSVTVPGARIPVQHMKIKGIRQIGQQQVEIKVKGSEIEEIYNFSQSVAQKFRTVEGLTGINISMDMSKPEYRVFIDRARASALGIPIRRVADTLQSLVQGLVATRYREGTDYYNIRVMVPEAAITGKSDLARLLVEGDNGKQYFLSDFAEVVRAVGPVEIVREDQVKEVIVRANSDGISVGEANKRAEAAVRFLGIPSGISYEMGGQAEMMADMKQTALLVAVFAIFFAFVVLAVQFESLKLPAVIIVSVPLCLIGIVFGLNTSGFALGATVLIGLLIVVSATVNDGVLLLSFAEELRIIEKQPVRDAILNAAGIRLRPRVMTTMSTIAGFVPLALNLGEGADLLQPMAIGAIGGLIFELFVALFFMPCLYLVISRH